MRVLVLSLVLIAAPKSRAEAPSEGGANRDERAKYSFTADWEVLGLTGIVAASGGQVGYYLDADNVLQAGFVTGRTRETRDDLDSDIRATFTYLTLKIFALDTLFANVGLAQREFAADLNGTAGTDPEADDVGTRVRTRYLGIIGGVGNQWHFRQVHVGCEWIGAFMPVSKQRRDVSYSFAPLRLETSKERDKSEQLVREGTRLSLNALRLSIGVSL